MSEEQQPPATPAPEEAAQAAEGKTNITVSRGMADWLISNKTSFAFTSYQTGQLFLVGITADNKVSFNQQNFQRAMGVCYTPGRLYLGSLFQVWRLENMLMPGQIGNKQFDMVLIPRNAQTVGDVDVHEVGIDAGGHVLFVNTKYSCLAQLDLVHSFKPIWKPPFISKLVGEDRCHLNGLAMDGGQPRFVTAVSRSDTVNGWRERRHEGGVLIEVETGRIVTDQLSMPHSPRVHDGKVYVLDSGRGQLVRVDPESGEKTDIAFCPGFLRGLSIHNGHAIVTISKPRDGSFSGLALDGEMEKRDSEPWCGVLVINLANGDIAEWVRLDGHIVELFDVAAMPGVRCPMSIGPNTIEIRNTHSFNAAALDAPAEEAKAEPAKQSEAAAK
ncbi:TIGR03032 family protein [Parasphingopyxis marina]|uniref:TIGR03032 family protein n=1 Tax=Parasphingopyxis marina TaxID=2761622 RepID=A0A842HWS6_9SPHN|nr:TIGR03032 family protein [Parasphingopyxis marina]MBC2776400.1 TIGR03032 family protein [Parasphingopyxis marina]